MKFFHPEQLGLLLICVLAYPVSAHHNSGPLFQMDKEVIIEGTVTRFDWKNPHLYLFIETINAGGEASEWRIEGRPLTSMRRLGWNRETLRAGDQATVRLNPARNPDKSSGLLVGVKVAGRDIPPVRGDAASATFLRDDYVATSKPVRLSGTWITLANPQLFETLDNPEHFNLTAAGQESLEAYDELSMHPGLECIPMAPPVFMIVVDTKSIEVSGDIAYIRGDFDSTERTIYFDDREAAGRSIHGHSKGHWDGNALVIETTHFANHRIGGLYGVASGSEKKLSERLEPDADGTRLTYGFRLTDPEHLAEPVSGEVEWVYRPDIDFTMSACDLENSRLYLEDED